MCISHSFAYNCFVELSTCTVEPLYNGVTIGTSNLVLLIEVSLLRGHLTLSKWDKKTVPCSEVSSIQGCPL